MEANSVSHPVQRPAQEPDRDSHYALSQNDFSSSYYQVCTIQSLSFTNYFTVCTTPQLVLFHGSYYSRARHPSTIPQLVPLHDSPFLYHSAADTSIPSVPYHQGRLATRQPLPGVRVTAFNSSHSAMLNSSLRVSYAHTVSMGTEPVLGSLDPP